MKRYDMKKILADPVLRRRLIVRSVIATQAREDIAVSWADAYRIYDEQFKERADHEKEKRHRA